MGVAKRAKDSAMIKMTKVQKFMYDHSRRRSHRRLAPKSAADFAFLLHGFHYLKDQGVMAIILPHGVLFRGGADEKIRTKLLKDGHIDTVIGLPPNLFYSTGIPVCILVLKKCKKPDDVLFINAAEHFDKGRFEGAGPLLIEFRKNRLNTVPMTNGEFRIASDEG
jgi:type I restriction-modification system DNA methylase subunit